MGMINMKALLNGKIILGDGVYKNKVILMDEKIRGIIDIDLFKPEEEVEIIDVAGHYISPGFIDIHIHGCGGSDTMDGTIKDLNMISKTIIQYGTTSFLATTMTTGIESIQTGFEAVRQAKMTGVQGANILGVHMEGPFINKEFKGAQKVEYIVKPDFQLVKEYTDIIKIITIAPEIEGALEFIKKVKATGETSSIIISIGHSKATYEETLEAIEAGISHGTHLFNAMPPLHHRSPGTVGALLNSNVASCEMIADNIHVHPAIYQLVMKLKGFEKLILVSDAIRATSMKDGEYELGGQLVSVKEGRAELENGSLAGSVLTLNKAIKNFINETKAPLHEVIKSVTISPAKLIGIDKEKGSIEIGKDADIVVFDENIIVKQVFIAGDKRIDFLI